MGLIGRNLTNKHYITFADDPGVPPTQALGIPADPFGTINRPRQIMLQVTVRPDKFWR